MSPVDGYPTEKELEQIDTWQGTARELVEYLRTIWWAPDWGFHVKGKRILQLELHTGGWSGNEDIIAGLQETFLWMFSWQMSRRGGHHYFRIPFPDDKKLWWGKLGSGKQKDMGLD